MVYNNENYEIHSKVSPGVVPAKLKEIFVGDYNLEKWPVLLANITRIDSQSFQIKYVPAEKKVERPIGGGDIVFGLDNLEKKIGNLLAIGNPKGITIFRDHDLKDQYTLYFH